MTTREKMISWREKNGVTLEVLGKECGISPNLLQMVEEGHVTHPRIAKKIQKAYHLNSEEAMDLYPKEKAQEVYVGFNRWNKKGIPKAKKDDALTFIVDCQDKRAKWQNMHSRKKKRRRSV